MISIEKCKAVLMQSDEEFTEEEIKKIRDYLYQTGTIEYDSSKQN